MFRAIRTNPVLMSHAIAAVIVLVVVIATGNSDDLAAILTALGVSNGAAGIAARALVTPTHRLVRRKDTA